MSASETSTDNSPLIDELRSWLDDNWDPDLTVGEWWEKLGTAGWSSPILPENAYGKGVSRSEAVQCAQELGAYGALGAPSGLGLLLAAPTIADHGTQEQIDHYVYEIVTGKKAWCQLFSEPGAGSDLAGLTARAVEDGEEYIVTGQKVWTSLGQTADMGMLLARTDWDVPKHQGITWFAIDMHQDAVDMRPLIEMTGHAMFNEVFLEEAHVPASGIIGGKNNGWAAANTTLQNERAGLGAGGGGAGSTATPGTIAGNLDRRAGDFVREVKRPKKGKTERKGPRPSGAQMQIGLAQGAGKASDPVVRQQLMKLHTMFEIGRYNAERVKANRAKGVQIPGMANIAKLGQSDIVRAQRDIGLSLLGPKGMLHPYTDEQRNSLTEATEDPFISMITGTALYAQAPPIYGGTDQIQKNIIGERVLGLPKEPSDDRTKPFSELPRNT